MNADERKRLRELARYQVECGLAWEPDARLIGNMKASDAARVGSAVITLLDNVDRLERELEDYVSRYSAAANAEINRGAQWASEKQRADEAEARVKELESRERRITDNLISVIAPVCEEHQPVFHNISFPDFISRYKPRCAECSRLETEMLKARNAALEKVREAAELACYGPTNKVLNALRAALDEVKP